MRDLAVFVHKSSPGAKFAKKILIGAHPEFRWAPTDQKSRSGTDFML
jgi:hypothetical protein